MRAGLPTQADAPSGRDAYAQDSWLRLEPGADIAAPGAAITLALCGSWEHLPPCPLTPHHTATEALGAELLVRTLFAAAPEDEPEVRRRIVTALCAGVVTDREAVGWEFLRSEASELQPEEMAHAGRLLVS